MYDCFLFCQDLAWKHSTILADLSLTSGSYYLATVHREQNTDNITDLMDIIRAFREIAEPTCPVVFPVHPRTEKRLRQYEGEKLETACVRLIPPVSYFDMIVLETEARLIITDSGGVQKEAYFSSVPCVTLRNETEWTETLETGWNKIAGTAAGRIVEACRKALASVPVVHPRLYGDGRSAP
jgi:UDP-N-acetylglucosamine 2-epimerase